MKNPTSVFEAYEIMNKAGLVSTSHGGVKIEAGQLMLMTPNIIGAYFDKGIGYMKTTRLLILWESSGWRIFYSNTANTIPPREGGWFSWDRVDGVNTTSETEVMLGVVMSHYSDAADQLDTLEVMAKNYRGEMDKSRVRISAILDEDQRIKLQGLAEPS